MHSTAPRTSRLTAIQRRELPASESATTRRTRSAGVAVRDVPRGVAHEVRAMAAAWPRWKEHGLTEHDQVVAPSTSRSTPAPRAATLLLRPASVRTPTAQSDLEEGPGLTCCSQLG
jgi:hypothetical protein